MKSRGDISSEICIGEKERKKKGGVSSDFNFAREPLVGENDDPVNDLVVCIVHRFHLSRSKLLNSSLHQWK